MKITRSTLKEFITILLLITFTLFIFSQSKQNNNFFLQCKNLFLNLNAKFEHILFSQAFAFHGDQNSANPYLIQDVEGYADLGTLDDSKSAVSKEASNKAFNILMQRIVPFSFLEKAQNLSEDSIKDYVQNITTINERMTSHSYNAVYDIIFDKTAIESMLSKNGIRYADSYSPATLMIPVLHTNDGYNIGNRQSTWYSAWGQTPEVYGLIHNDVVEGTLQDIENIKPETIMNESYDSLSLLLGQYECTRVCVIYAEQTTQGKIEISVRLLDKDKEILRFANYQKNLNEEEIDLYKRISSDILMKLDNLWKGEDLFDQETIYSSKAFVMAKDPQTWSAIRKILDSLDDIRSYKVIQNKFDVVELELNYSVAPATLSNIMLQKGLKVENKAGDVLITIK